MGFVPCSGCERPLARILVCLPDLVDGTIMTVSLAGFPIVTTLMPAWQSRNRARPAQIVQFGRLWSETSANPAWRCNCAVSHGGRPDRCLPARNLCRHMPRCRDEKYPFTLGPRHTRIRGVGRQTQKDVATIEFSRRTRCVIAVSPRPSCWRPVLERASRREQLVSQSA